MLCVFLSPHGPTLSEDGPSYGMMRRCPRVGPPQLCSPPKYPVNISSAVAYRTGKPTRLPATSFYVSPHRIVTNNGLFVEARTFVSAIFAGHRVTPVQGP